MIEEIGSMLGEMLQLFFMGFWALLKLSAKGTYAFFFTHTRYLFLIAFLLIAAIYRDQMISVYAKHIFLNQYDLHIAQDQLKGIASLIGSPVAPGDFATGPLYNALITPILWYNNYNPLALARFAFFIQIATVGMLYIVGKRFFSYQAGLFAAGLYAVSPFVYSYAQDSWRLDILPFFVLLLIMLVFNAAASARPFLTFLGVGLVLSICLQIHYAALFLAVLVFSYVLIAEIILNKKMFFMPFLRDCVAMGIGFLILSFPFLLHEFTHGFSQTQAMFAYLIKSVVHTDFLAYFNLYARLITRFPSQAQAANYTATLITIWGVFALLLAIASYVVFIFVRNKFVVLLMSMWVVLGVIFLSLFSKTIYEYHFTPLFPAFFLLIGNLLASLYHLQEQERVKMAQQIVSSTAQSQTYTTIPIDVTNKKKLVLHYICVTSSILLFVFLFLLNFTGLFF